MRKSTLLLILFLVACGTRQPSPSLSPIPEQDLSTPQGPSPIFQDTATEIPSPEPDDENICVVAYPGSQDTVGLLTNPYDQQELHTKHIRRGTRCEILDHLRNVDFPLDERGVVDVYYATCSGYKVYIYTDYCE